MESKADAIVLATEITLLHALRARGDRISQIVGNNHMLTIGMPRIRLLLPKARLPPTL